MPAGLVKALRDQVAEIVFQPELKAQLASQGMTPIASEPEDWKRYVEAELSRWTAVIKEANIRPEQ
jgi:tripartite-type tricarboxylate transporter receptor subunit TctC